MTLKCSKTVNVVKVGNDEFSVLNITYLIGNLYNLMLKNHRVYGVPWWPMGKGLSIVTAMACVQSLAWELPHALLGYGKKEGRKERKRDRKTERNDHVLTIACKIPGNTLSALQSPYSTAFT